MLKGQSNDCSHQRKNDNNRVSVKKNVWQAEVVLPVSQIGTLTYLVPDEWQNELMPGSRVVVQLGASKIYTALVIRVFEGEMPSYRLKPIINVLDQTPLMTPEQLAFQQWLMHYYLCSPGDVLQAALPSGFNIEATSMIDLMPGISADLNSLTEPEKFIYLKLKEKEGKLKSALKVDALIDKKNGATVWKALNGLREKNLISIYQELKEKYVPKYRSFFSLAPAYQTDDGLNTAFDLLEKKPAMQSSLMKWLQLAPEGQFANVSISKADLEKQKASAESLKGLVKVGILLEEKIQVPRFELADVETTEINLSERQQQAFEEILAGFEKQQTVLLHGVTGSGKTEIYIRLIQAVLAEGDQALLMLPEIALTTQMVVRLKAYFGSELGVYHSRFSDNERVEVWQGLKSNRLKVIVGVRSSVFLPFQNLALVIVDEEHEPSYKQQDPAPRYHARDAAAYLSQLHHARLLLGSATPSLESYQHARSGKYHLVNLLERFGRATLPEIKMVDLRKDRPENHISKALEQLISQTLEAGNQAILFQNRRGYSPFMTCLTCGWESMCKNCDVSLTYYHSHQEMRCHYCGHIEPVLKICPVCKDSNLKMHGYGTEKLEDELKNLFPNRKIARMDYDTTRAKNSFSNLIEDMAQQKTDILVGTQMVTKGLDFDKVQLVGVFDIDRILHFPDFRSSERVFQMLVQVSGRAGRRKEPGTVAIQTWVPDRKLFAWVAQHNFQEFYQTELAEREKFNYPPFSRIIQFECIQEKAEKAREAAQLLASQLQAVLGKERVLGPEPPPISKINNEFIFRIIVKLERNQLNISKVKAWMRSVIQQIHLQPHLKKVKIVADVDPV